MIGIRTLAEAGGPLARVRELLQADEEVFAAAVADIDRRLREEILQRERHRERIARLAAGDQLVLPPLADRPLIAFYFTLGEALDQAGEQVEDARLAELADELAAYISQMADEKGEDYVDDVDIEPSMVRLMDAMAFDTVPPARRLVRLLRTRGWTGWTRLERVAP